MSTQRRPPGLAPKLAPAVTLALTLALATVSCTDSNNQALAVGTLERDRLDLRADSNEPLLELLVQEGDRVAAGTLLARQDNQLADAALAAAKARAQAAADSLAQAVAGTRPEQLDQARAVLAGADAAVTIANTSLRRAQDTARGGFTSAERIDELSAALAQATANQQVASAQLAELVAGPRQEIIQRLRSELAAAEQAVAAAAVAEQRTRLLAPVAGQVEALPFEVGERPVANSTLVALLADGRLYARIHLPAPLRAQLRIGSPADVLVEGEEHSRSGRVHWIANEAAFTPFYALTQHDRSRLAFLAEVDLDNPGDLPVGVPVEVRFPGLEPKPEQP